MLYWVTVVARVQTARGLAGLTVVHCKVVGSMYSVVSRLPWPTGTWMVWSVNCRREKSSSFRFAQVWTREKAPPLRVFAMGPLSRAEGTLGARPASAGADE